VCQVVIRSLRLLAYVGIERDMHSTPLQATPTRRSSNASHARVKRESCQSLAGNARGERETATFGMIISRRKARRRVPTRRLAVRMRNSAGRIAKQGLFFGSRYVR
jgi:hypothetical protein